jgi:hypothetical protein
MIKTEKMPATEQVGLEIKGKWDGESGTYYHLNTGSTVKSRLLPGAAIYVCLNSVCIAARKANECHHVSFVAMHEASAARAEREAAS